MNDLTRFRPAFYGLLMVGVVAYCGASEEFGVSIFVVLAILLNLWLVTAGEFRPMPRLVSGLVTLAAFFVCLSVLWGSRENIVTVVGDFLMFLHLVKLYEQRGDRDIAQVLILNLMLVVSGSISTASLWFAVTMGVYLVMALYVSLALYQKMEFEATARLMGRDPTLAVSPAHSVVEARQFHRSVLRVMSYLVGVSLAVGVGVFLFFPRGLAADMLGAPPVMQVADPVTGLDDQTQVEQMVKVSQDTEIVARATETINGKPARGTQALWLRGKTVDVYNGSGADPAKRAWVWEAGADSAGGPSTPPAHPEAIGGKPIEAWSSDEDSNHSDANSCSITLTPTGTQILVVPGRPLVLTASTTITPPPRLAFFTIDWTLRSSAPINWPFTYTVTFDPHVSPPHIPEGATISRGGTTRPDPVSVIDPDIRHLAQDPAVCGVDANGISLAELAMANKPSTDPNIGTNVAGAIARNFESYLRDKKRYRYTLDMSDQEKIRGDRDPIAVFLTETKSGYCEFFASAMTLMCQSVGLHARMVFGYRSEEFSSVGGYYVIRQSDAHAWTEVLVGDNPNSKVWERYDPTTGNEIIPPDRSVSGEFMQFLDFLNYKWATAVVTYDQPAREQVVRELTGRMFGIADATKSLIDTLSMTSDARAWLISPTLPAALILLLSLFIVAAIAWYVIESTRLRRRARRVGVDGLDRSDRYRLVRQLAFYDQMIVLLERHDILRQPQMTPLEFSQSLWFLPPQIYEDIHRLTRVFYRIRYGQAQIDEGAGRRLVNSIDRIAEALDAEKFHRPRGSGESV